MKATEDEVESFWLKITGKVVKENGTLQVELRQKAAYKNVQ